MPEGVDHHLRRQVAEVSNLVVRLTENVHRVSGQVSAVDAAQRDTRSELAKLRDDFQAYVRRSEMLANVQRAETRVGRIQDEIEHDFGHHKVVRRTATGLLQAFDLGLVSEETVRAVSEELMISTPRYWLAPALVALASWAADDRSLCERAVAEAYRRSPERTSLLFSLVLRRQGRRPASVRWLRHYLAAQDPGALGREFAVILECLAQSAFGLEGRELLRDTLDRWSARMAEDEQAQGAQVARWRAELESLRAPSAAAAFPRLAAVCPQWPELDAALAAARVHRAALEKYTAVLGEAPAAAERVEDAIDDILDRLVSEYDPEELPKRRALAFEQAVIDHDGDLAAARSRADADAASFDETLDCLTVQTSAALTPEAVGVSAATRRMAVIASREWFGRAHGGFTRDYRAALPPELHASVTAAQPIGQRTFTLPRWMGRLSDPLPGLEADLARHWAAHTGPFLASFAFPLARRLIAPLAVVAAILLFGSSDIGAALLVAAVVAAGWGAVINHGYQAALRAQEQARQVLERARTDSLHQLRGAAAELTDWQTAYLAAEEFEPRTRQFIASLATAAQPGSPFEGRAVVSADRGRGSGG